MTGPLWLLVPLLFGVGFCVGGLVAFYLGRCVWCRRMGLRSTCVDCYSEHQVDGVRRAYALGVRHALTGEESTT